MANWRRAKGFFQRAGYRSGLEDNIQKQLDKLEVSYEYEPAWGKIKYEVPAVIRTYTPDFYITTASGKVIVVESKGLWDIEDRKKHLLIKQQFPDLDIRFVFSNAKKKISKRSTTTYKDICEGRGRGKFKGITWKFSEKEVPKEWLDE